MPSITYQRYTLSFWLRNADTQVKYWQIVQSSKSEKGEKRKQGGSLKGKIGQNRQKRVFFKKETDGWVDIDGDKRWNFEDVLYQRPFQCYNNWSPRHLCVLSVERVNCACTAGGSNSTSIPYIYPHNTWETVSYFTPQPAWSEICNYLHPSTMTLPFLFGDILYSRGTK